MAHGSESLHAILAQAAVGKREANSYPLQVQIWQICQECWIAPCTTSSSEPEHALDDIRLLSMDYEMWGRCKGASFVSSSARNFSQLVLCFGAKQGKTSSTEIIPVLQTSHCLATSVK